jgi:peptide deformylase
VPRHPPPRLDAMSTFDIRYFGDPVLRARAEDVTNVDGALVKVTERMVETMYAAPGLGLAAPQVGIGKRLFVYDLNDGDGAKVLVNPEIRESRGEWVFDEGCLSVPGLSWEIVRPKEIHIVGFDLDGNDVDVEATELLSRLYQHEMDHLDGKLLIDYLPDDERADALRVLRNRILEQGHAGDPAAAPKSVPKGARAGEPAPAKNRFGISLPGLK